MNNFEEKIIFKNGSLFIGNLKPINLNDLSYEIFNEEHIRFLEFERKIISRHYKYFINSETDKSFNSLEDLINKLEEEKSLVNKTPNLLINKLVNPKKVNIKDFNFTLLSEVTKESPLYEKGRKVSSNYYYNDKILSQKIFEDVIENDRLKSLKMTINWFNEDESIGLSKTQIVKNFNRAEEKTELRKRRQRAIDYLIASAEEKGQSWFINILLKKFKYEIELFVENGTDDFKNTILNEQSNLESEVVIPEQNITVRDILNSKLPPTELYPEGQTVAEGIIEEIV